MKIEKEQKVIESIICYHLIMCRFKFNLYSEKFSYIQRVTSSTKSDKILAKMLETWNIF